MLAPTGKQKGWWTAGGLINILGVQKLPHCCFKSYVPCCTGTRSEEGLFLLSVPCCYLHCPSETDFTGTFDFTNTMWASSPASHKLGSILQMALKMTNSAVSLQYLLDTEVLHLLCPSIRLSTARSLEATAVTTASPTTAASTSVLSETQPPMDWLKSTGSKL